MEKKKQILGECPQCGNKELQYGLMTPEGEAIRYEVDCQKCGWVGYEWYSISFLEYTNR